MIKCVCLVEEKNHQLLLVQVRHRDKYYFPGGKIDEGESLVEAFNGFKVNRAIDWSKVETDHEITDMKWFDINDSENIAPAVNTWIKEFIND
ncbi:MAG: DNA mismatch repair protein MutT [Staphylococcus epidermidis]|nr:DNA mismatch repair protein MutT [Staphylococcus epidermidis]